MIVIVPHPTEELILIRAQKKLIAQLFQAKKLIYAHTPLWIETLFADVEQAKKEITGVTVLAPEYEDAEKCIVCPVVIQSESGKTRIKLRFIEGKELPQQIDAGDCGEFPLALKIFRLGECTCPKPGVYELSNCVWKKL